MIRRTRRPMPYVPLASMGDIAFLLIIFFMLNATFLKDKNIPLNPAQSSDLEKVETAQISVSVDRDGIVRLQGNQITAKSLEIAVEHMLAGRDDRTVRLSVDRNLTKPSYLPVIEALSQAGATLQVTGVQFEQGSAPSGESP